MNKYGYRSLSFQFFGVGIYLMAQPHNYFETIIVGIFVFSVSGWMWQKAEDAR